MVGGWRRLYELVHLGFRKLLVVLTDRVVVLAFIGHVLLCCGYVHDWRMLVI